MADNKSFRDGNGTLYTASLEELGDGSFAPKVGGNVAHDAADEGAPVKMGGRALAHGSNPTAVAAGDRTDWLFNRHGIPFMIGGHPNVLTRGHTISDSNGAQTDTSLLTVSSGTKIAITRMTAICDNANTGDVAVVIGFGDASPPDPTLTGADGIIVNGSFDGGAGVTIGDGSGIIAIGGDGQDLRLTCDDPAGGNLRITYSYFTIES